MRDPFCFEISASTGRTGLALALEPPEVLPTGTGLAPETEPEVLPTGTGLAPEPEPEVLPTGTGLAPETEPEVLSTRIGLALEPEVSSLKNKPASQTRQLLITANFLVFCFLSVYIYLL